MLFAFFTSCLITAATGNIECTNSYTEMASVASTPAACNAQAAKLQANAINSVLLDRPGSIAVYVRSGCGPLKEVMREAENTHNSYVNNGIKSVLFSF